MNLVTNQLLILPKKTEKDELKLKRDSLIAWILKKHINSGIIFCNSKNSVRGLVLSLSHGGIKACGMHSQMSSTTLSRNIEKFAHMESNFIICADDAIDGIEIPCVETLFNFDCPESLEVFNLRKKVLDESVDNLALTIISTKEIAIIKDIVDSAKENNDSDDESFQVVKVSEIFDDIDDVPVPSFLEKKKVKKVAEPKKYVEESFTVRRNRYRNAESKENKYITMFFNRADSNINDYLPEFIKRKITIKI